jgi:hypothetical protein
MGKQAFSPAEGGRALCQTIYFVRAIATFTACIVEARSRRIGFAAVQGEGAPRVFHGQRGPRSRMGVCRLVAGAFADRSGAQTNVKAD